MKPSKLLFGLLISSAFLATPSFAGSVGGVKITSLIPVYNGVLSFTVSGPSTGAPACAGSLTSNWVIDASTVAGQQLAAAVITAFSLGSTIDIQGLGTCNALQYNEEQVRYLVVYK